jgi:hypothetical protein
MPPGESVTAAVSRREYEQRLIVDRLRREVFQQSDPSANPELLEKLAEAEQVLQELERERLAQHDSASGVILDSTKRDGRRGLGTTGLEAKISLNMAHFPTSICHLLNREENPLLTCEVAAARTAGRMEKRRVRLTSFIEGYSARAIDTFELPVGESHSFQQLPTLFPAQLNQVTELTRATLNILVEDLDGNVELHVTQPIWLLARTSAPLAVWDPQTGGWQDLTRYLGAFVTPNAPALMTFLREAARRHPEGQLVGYQISEEAITPQVEALFDALKSKGEMTYVNSLIDFNPEQGSASQRVRLPRESLADHQANCIDGAVLFASLLEAISLHPALVLIPGHAFVAWETWRDSGQWRYLETTMIGSNSFEEACASAETTAGSYQASQQLRLWPLAELRTGHGITPME